MSTRKKTSSSKFYRDTAPAKLRVLRNVDMAFGDLRMFLYYDSHTNNRIAEFFNMKHRAPK